MHIIWHILGSHDTDKYRTGIIIHQLEKLQHHPHQVPQF